MPQTTINDVCSYLYCQRYLNAELIIIANNFILPPNGKKFIHDHINYIKYVNNTKNDSNSTILKKNSISSIFLEIKIENFKNLDFVENYYKKNILKNEDST